MSTLFDPNAIPDAPELPVATLIVSAPKKRKSYYVPVAERAKEKSSAKREATAAKKAELAVREGKDAVVPNAKKRSALAKAIKKTITKDVTKTAKARSKPEADKGGGTSDEAVCSLCHKPLSRHTSVSAGMGEVCQSKIKLLPVGTTMEDHYEKITVWELPDGYIKLKDAIEKLNAKGISTYRVLQAIGGDRMLRKPINSNFKIVIFGRTRYINGACIKNWRDLEKV